MLMLTAFVIGLLPGYQAPPAVASPGEYCSAERGCDYRRVALLRCETDKSGGIVVGNASLTSAVPVRVRRGDKCAATVSALLRSGLAIVNEPTVVPAATGDGVSFGFVFVPWYGDSDDDDWYDDDDDRRGEGSGEGQGPGGGEGSR